ncbi:MAG: orotidine-5'-phosphate decarboxylase [Acidobacteria bacterium]|nr:orotidine-5'-phosphate decarboxylase [Acidobacteriota bacterium]
MEPHKRLIVALDTSSESQALEWVRLLGPRCGAVKVGMQLYASGGPQIVRTIRDAGAEIFLDLKLHDIPTTVAKATQALMPLEPLMLNFHALGGVTMLGEAAEAAKSLCEKQRLRPPILLAVTILTSHDETSLRTIGIAGPIPDQVTRLAVLSKGAGLDGVVASAREVALVRQACGAQFTVVTPGIRPSSAAVDDQVRTMTPAAAIAAGVDYMVIGRPITHAPDPVRALEDIIAGLSTPPPVA